ncbi:MAG TPA: hypothetical protein VJH23_03280 [archaeon]|nr:hypothetical protein [archaeon]
MRQVYALFLIYMMFFPALAFASNPLLADFADPPSAQDPRTLIETPEQTAARETGTGVQTTSATQGVPQVNEFMCASSQLPGNETQNLIDLLKKGFTGNEIAGQTSKDTDREKLDANTIVLTKPGDENVAVKGEVPSLKFKPWEISQFLNNSIKGPFSLGVVLDDSLRAGRCESMSSSECGLTGPNLKYRNSGAGIVADLKPIQEVFTKEDTNKFSAAENEVLKNALVAKEPEDAQVKTAARLEKQLISNSILSDSFSAKLETNCNNSSCVISTYSLFDKYFNSWMSSEMVVSAFGPSLLYHTKKLFGWSGRRGFFSGVRDGYQEFADKFRAQYITNDSPYGKILTNRIKTRLDKYPGWREWWQKVVGGKSDGTGYYLFKTEEYQDLLGEALGHDGFLTKMKSLEERGEFIRLLEDMRSVLRGGYARVKGAQGAFQDAEKAAKIRGVANVFEDPVVRQKYREYGQEMIRMMDDVYDESNLGADYIEWVARYPNAGFYDKGVKIVTPDGQGEVVNLFQDHRNLQRILKQLKDDPHGGFSTFPNKLAEYGQVFETRGDKLVLYSFDEATAKAGPGVSYSNVKAAAKNSADAFIPDQYGNYIPYNAGSAEYIQNRLTSNVTSVKYGGWKEWGEITPEDVIARIDSGRTGVNANMKFGHINIEQTLDALREQNWVSRRYWSALDKLTAQENELIRSYFTVKGGAKWTALPFGYWWAKKGFGIEGISQYQLPETWHRLSFTTGAQNIYDYAYLDFFANEGSDQGDLFVQVINKLPWKLVLDELSEKYNPVKNLYDALTKNELRNETENLAFYLTGPEDCANCSLTLRSDDLTRFRPFFFTENQKLVSYILEDTVSQAARDKGQTLIMFAAHTNLIGQSGNEKGEPINLADAINDKKTCSDALDQLNLYGISLGKIIPDKLKEKGRIGAVLGGLESITYGTFFWAGIFATATIQIVVVPQLQDCIDVDEGYYVHYFVPVLKKEDKKTNSTEISTEKVSNLVQRFKSSFVDTFQSDKDSLTKDAAQKLGDELDRFQKDSKENNLVQATLRLEGLNSGQLDSTSLFYFWCGKGCEMTPASYKQSGSEEIRGVNGLDVGIDFAKGEITLNGSPIVQTPDNVRLATTNLNGPFIEIPNTLTETCLENTTEKAFEINAQGEVRVVNKELLDCIKKGVIEQTGLTLDSEKLNDAFGKLEAIVTTTHPNIRPLGDKIQAEGVPRKVAEGKNATVTVLANKDVNLSSSNDGETSVGKLESLQFANGVIIVKPNGCFLAWLKHHEDGILSKELAKGLKTDLERAANPETGCADPVVNFEVLPDLGSDLQAAKVDKFNKALQHQGPFTVFETPTQRYVISAEKNAQGVCEDHLRVIDKATGKVTDYTGTISQTPDGFKITTNDGQTHEVKFSTKDGAPIVQLDENKPEVLIAAQGKNGSFYYDPDKGLWFAENAQLLPLIDAFREGIAAKVQPNGETTATATGNVLNVDLGKKDSSFLNLPSLPEERLLLLLFIALIVGSFIYTRRNAKKR